MPQLRYRIGRNRYKVQVAHEPLVDAYGQHAWGLCHSDRKLIEISPTCPPGERFEVMLHELRHAWCNHFPRPADEEGDADHYAAMTSAIFEQTMEQGGPGVVLSLELDALTDFDPARFVTTLTERGLDRCFHCNVCQQRVAPGSVLVTNPRPHPTLGSSMVGLAFMCPHCDHVQHWGELANTAGNPTGVCCLEPEYMTAEETAIFCSNHPDKTHFHPAA